jgi:hypothetical protein
MIAGPIDIPPVFFWVAISAALRFGWACECRANPAKIFQILRQQHRLPVIT